MKLHMCLYLRAKFEVSSIILTSFRLGAIYTPPPPLPPRPLTPPQNETLKSPPRLGLKSISLTNEIASFRFSRKIFCKRKLTVTQFYILTIRYYMSDLNGSICLEQSCLDFLDTTDQKKCQDG